MYWHNQRVRLAMARVFFNHGWFHSPWNMGISWKIIVNIKYGTILVSLLSLFFFFLLIYIYIYIWYIHTYVNIDCCHMVIYIYIYISLLIYNTYIYIYIDYICIYPHLHQTINAWIWTWWLLSGVVFLGGSPVLFVGWPARMWGPQDS